jgi:hypothetical protein
LHRHQDGLAEAIRGAEPRIAAQLKAAGHWFASHMPMKLLSMLETDMPAISPENSQKLVFMAYEAMFSPIARLFAAASERGEVRPIDPNKLAGHFLSLMDGVSYSVTAGFAVEPIDQLLEDMIDVFLNGIYPR